MSNIYLIAVNYDKRNRAKNPKDTTMGWMRLLDAPQGNDIAGWATSFPYNEGWRIYPFTVMRERDAQARQMVDYWMQNIAEH